MPAKQRNELYDLFATGNKPTQDDFVDLIDSMINIAEDGIGISEKGKPMEIIQQGEKQRLLDLSSSKDTPIWRVGAQSVDGARNGLNIATSDNTSRLFINQETGFTGINTDDPTAKLHIISDSVTALRVDDSTKNPLLVIEADGSIGIGANPQESYKVAMNGKVHLQGEATIDGSVYAGQGITVDGAKLNAQKGLSVQNGLAVETGLLEAKAGLTVTQNALNANGGAIISGSVLEVKDGLTVKNGAIIETGNLEAKAGVTVNGALLQVNNGLTVQGKTTLCETIVETGLLTVKNGISVTNGSALNAEGQVTLGSDTGDVIINGFLETKAGLQAGAGAIVSGSQLRVDNGLTVYNGATFETGIITVKEGLAITGDSAFSAVGPVVLGNPISGDVIANGKLGVTNGAEISGSELVVKNGVNITGNLSALDNSILGNVTIQKLEVNDITIDGNLGLQSINLQNLTAGNADVGDLKSGKLAISGLCQATDDVTFASGMIYATYQGPSSFLPKIKVQEGTVTGIRVDGNLCNFNFIIDDTKQVSIIYDEKSTINNFFYDWDDYKAKQPDKAEGFYFTRVGQNSWGLQDLEISLASMIEPYKEYSIVDKGLRILYSGSLAGTPQFEIKANEDTTAQGFEFVINGLMLTIKYPDNEEFRAVDRLILDWQIWTSTSLESIGNFEIQQTAATGQLMITDTNGTLETNIDNNFFYKGIIKTNTVSIGGYLKFSDSQVLISGVSNSDALAENSELILPTQKAVKTYIDNGLTPKADQSAMDTALATKADKSYVDTTLATKADQSVVDTALATKADKSYVDTSLTTKADQSAMDTSLASKAGLLKPNDLPVAIGATATVSDITLTTDSQGILMIKITTPNTAKAGLFAIYGTDSIIKIAGDGMSDQQDNTDTCNVYSNGGVVTIQNASLDDITAKVTYFGA